MALLIWKQRRVDAARPEPTLFGVPTALCNFEGALENFAQLHPCSKTAFTKREQRQAQHLEGWQRLRQHRAPGDHDK